ncbi:MAG: hypothetical protein ACFFD5_00440 [Candidatus Thorarchaeota archaeon]
MPEEREHHKDEDESIVEALSSLGWVEEKETEEEYPDKEEVNLQEQLNFFIEENKKLTTEIKTIQEEKDNFEQKFNELVKEKEKLGETLEKNNDTIDNLLQSIVQKDTKIKDLEAENKILLDNTESQDLEVERIPELNQAIETKNQEINSLKSQIDDLTKQFEEIDHANNEKIELLQNQKLEIDNLSTIINEQVQKIQEFNSQIESFKSKREDTEELVKKLQEKEDKIKEQMEQIQYLENDTIQKSKFEKVQLLAEKKDEIITEKEKTIFNMENTLKGANEKIKEMQQQLETFSLLKKDREKKEERIKELVLEVEKLNQKTKTNEDFIARLQKNLEDSQEKSGNITGKFELEIANLRNLIDDKDAEIKDMKENETQLKNKLYEAEQIEDRILTELQKVKDENIKFESEIEKKENELVDLKKKIKIMRRDMKKS